MKTNCAVKNWTLFARQKNKIDRASFMIDDVFVCFMTQR